MEATQVVFWPGQETYACDEHAQKLRNLASIMGFAVSSRPCEPQPCDNCENEAKARGRQ